MITEEQGAKGRATLAARFLKLRIGEYPKSKSHKVNRYVRFTAEMRACEAYLSEIQWQLRNRLFHLSGGQMAEATKILDGGPVERS